jgi:hypothetical protein
MRRAAHIAISMVVVLLLLKPFDCFSSAPFTRKTADCCKKGKCAPTSNSDDCCKGTLPGGKQLLESKSPQHTTLTLDLITTDAPALIAPVLTAVGCIDADAPTGSPPISNLNLPLLI